MPFEVSTISDLILSCPLAGPTTACESLFSNSRHGENFVFNFRIRSALLSACRRRRASRRMATDTAEHAAILRDAPRRGGAPHDEGGEISRPLSQGAKVYKSGETFDR